MKVKVIISQSEKNRIETRQTDGQGETNIPPYKHDISSPYELPACIPKSKWIQSVSNNFEFKTKKTSGSEDP